jgi:hypothetical protein
MGEFEPHPLGLRLFVENVTKQDRSFAKAPLFHKQVCETETCLTAYLDRRVSKERAICKFSGNSITRFLRSRGQSKKLPRIQFDGLIISVARVGCNRWSGMR